MASDLPKSSLGLAQGPGSTAGLLVGLYQMSLQPTYLASWLTLGGPRSPGWLPAL